MWQANLRWPSSERSVGIGSHHILSIYCYFCGRAESVLSQRKTGPSIRMLFIIYTTHWLLLLLILLFVSMSNCLSVRLVYECLARGRLSNLLYSLFLSLSLRAGDRGGLCSWLGLFCAFFASFYQFFILFMNSRRSVGPQGICQMINIPFTLRLPRTLSLSLSVSVSSVHKYVYLHTSINTDTFYLLHFFYNWIWIINRLQHFAFRVEMCLCVWETLYVCVLVYMYCRIVGY